MGSWRLISLSEALKRAKEAMAAGCRSIEKVDLHSSLGRIAAVDIICPEDNPGFDRATVDGYAVCSKDTQKAARENPVEFWVAGEIRMGLSADSEASFGEAWRIPTGGMLPVGADCVVMQEHVEMTEERKLKLFRPLCSGENMVKRGDDAIAGTVIVAAGHCIGIADLGILASCGIMEAPVVKKPVVTVITTGDEIVAPEFTPKPGQVRDVNSYTLSALASEAGCEVRLADRAPDRPDLLVETIKKAVEESDIVLISGGSSVGDRDFTTLAVTSLPEAKIIFHGVAIKPGKPTLMAMVGHTAVFGIPGHVVAAMTIFAEIVAPVIRNFMGVPGNSPRYFIKAFLGADLQPDNERDEIVRVILTRRNETVNAVPLPSRSGLITTMSKAHGLIYVQAGQPALTRGTEVDVQLLKNNEGIWGGRIDEPKS